MISGELVTLGAMKAEDSAVIFEWINDAELATLDRHWRPVDWAKHVGWFQSIGSDDSRVIFAVRSRRDGNLIGMLTITGIHQIHRSADLGLVIGFQHHRNQGFGQDAIALGLRYCFEALNMNRVQVSVFHDNAHALHLYRKLGFQQEGVQRQARFINGRWVDMVLLAMLRDDWMSRPII